MKTITKNLAILLIICTICVLFDLSNSYTKNKKANFLLSKLNEIEKSQQIIENLDDEMCSDCAEKNKESTLQSMAATISSIQSQLSNLQETATKNTDNITKLQTIEAEDHPMLIDMHRQLEETHNEYKENAGNYDDASAKQ